MEFGCCVGLDIDSSLLTSLQNIGCGHIELPINQIKELSNSDFKALCETLSNSNSGSSLKHTSFNLFIPGNIRLTGSGSESDLAAVKEHAKKCGERAAELGGRIIVFGSGGARNIPDGFGRNRGVEQIVDVLNAVSEIMDEYEITVAIEPLNRRESNVINTLREGYEIVQMVNKPNIKIMADYYHMSAEGETKDDILEYGEEICHVHFAEPVSRIYPSEYKQEYTQFFDALSKINYKSPIIFECSTKNILQDAKQSIDIFRGIMAYEQ